MYPLNTVKHSLPRWLTISWIIIAGVQLASLLTSYYLKLDFWYDEIYTLQHFVLVDFKKTLTDYHLPNNHILFNLICNLYIRAFNLGPLHHLMDTPIFLRVITIPITLGTIVGMYLLATRFFNQPIAVMSVSIMSTTLPFLNFATQIRGYTLSFMLVTFYFGVLVGFMRTGFKKYAIALSCISAALLYTIPLNAYIMFSALIGITLTTGVRNLYLKPRLIQTYIAVGIGSILSAVLFSIVDGSVIDNVYVRSAGFFRWKNVTIIFPLFFWYLLSYRYLLLLPLLIGSVLAYCYRRRHIPYCQEYGTLLAMLILPFVFSFIRGDVPFYRVFVNVIPIFSLLVALSVYYLSIIFFQGRGPSYFLNISVTVILCVCHVTLPIALAQRNQVLLDDINTGSTSQNIYYNYFQSYYQPNRISLTLSNSPLCYGAPIYTWVMDAEALPAYLSKHGLQAQQMSKVSELPLSQKMPTICVITGHPFVFQHEFQQHFPSAHCRFINNRLGYHNILLCQWGE